MSDSSHRFNWTFAILVVAGIASVVIFWVRGGKEESAPENSEDEIRDLVEPPVDNQSEQESLVGQPNGIETKKRVQPTPRRSPFFEEYGSSNLTVAEDLESIDKSFKAFWSIIKNPDAISLASNASITDYLSGRNREGIEFIPADSEYIDDEGQLLDRWQTPLRFHAISVTKIEVRSAGPDKKLYSEDDVVQLVSGGSSPY